LKGVGERGASGPAQATGSVGGREGGAHTKEPSRAGSTLAWGVLLTGLLLLPAGCAWDRSAPGLYRSYCKRCHGAEGEGKPRALKLYPKSNLLISEMVLQGDRDAVRDRIANGEGPMPAFKRRLTPEELESLVDFTIRLASEQEKKE
jgi:hypothetical protein